MYYARNQKGQEAVTRAGPSKTSETDREGLGPLDGVRVLDIATMLGAGHATALLADFGADVLHVEMPKRGDTLRGMGPFHAGHSLRWAVVGRNKRSVTIDLHTHEGQEEVRRLAASADVVVENFRPAKLQEWGLDYERLGKANPRLVMLSISGYGQTGPGRGKPGFGRVLEAVSGLMNVTGAPDGPPTQIGVPLVDYITGTVGAMGVSMALYRRDATSDARGQHIDLSLYETMVRILDSMITRYTVRGEIQGRMGNRYPNVAPSDVYRTRDGSYVFHSSAAQPIFERLMHAIGRPELINDERFRANSDRVKRVDEINDIVQDWFLERSIDEAMETLEQNDVPAGRINNAEDVARDDQLLSRESLTEVDVPGIGSVLMPGLVPKFSRTPGRINRGGPLLGQDQEDQLGWLSTPGSEAEEQRSSQS